MTLTLKNFIFIEDSITVTWLAANNYVFRLDRRTNMIAKHVSDQPQSGNMLNGRQAAME